MWEEVNKLKIKVKQYKPLAIELAKALQNNIALADDLAEVAAKTVSWKMMWEN